METQPDDGTMKINGMWCRPEGMERETLQDLRQSCFDAVTERLTEIQLITEVLENDTV